MPLRPPFDSAQETALLTSRRLQVLEELRDLDSILELRSHVGDGCPGCTVLRAMYGERQDARAHTERLRLAARP